MKNDIDENKEKEVIQKAYHYNKFLVIWFIAVFIILVLRITKIITDSYLAWGFGLLIVIYAISLHVQNHKLKIKSRIITILLFILL